MGTLDYGSSFDDLFLLGTVGQFYAHFQLIESHIIYEIKI